MSIVTVAELRAHLSMQADEESDDLLQQKIDAAEDWVAGYIGRSAGDLYATPAIKEAVLRVAADLYENREASLVGVSADLLPFGVTDLLLKYKCWQF